jgi:RHS repeat-associated protein
MAPPDGAVPPGTSCPAAQPTNDVFTLYSGNTTTVTDQAGKSRKSVTDALGRLMQVFEGPSGLNYETDYAYDVLSNLLTVNQQGGSTNSANWRTRTFTYDSLSRLLTTSNPESGNITYTYDNDGNVHTKTDARNIATTYNYDALNRLGGKSYSDGTETVYYNYDTPPGWMSDSTNVVGRLANTSNSSGGSADGKATAATYSYDAMGRVIRNWQQTPSTSPGGSFVYQSYDLAGNVTSATNAAGVAVSYTYDAVARPTKATSSWSDAQHPATLYTVDPSVGYFPGGAIRKATLANGLTESAMYNNRLQPCRMEINSTAASFAQCTDAVPSGNLLDFNYGFNSGVSDNGNVATWSSIGNQTFTRSYVYDSVNRISTLSDTAAAQTCKGLSWTIDPWGNRTDQTVTSGTCNTFHSGAALTNNRLGSPYTYDFAGNMTYDGVHHYTYDAENHLIQVDAGATAIYIYDPSGNRVRKNSGGSWTEFFYDFSGNVTAEHNPAGWPVEYIYFGGQLIAQYRDGTTYSVFRDHLGSTRLITKLDKSVYDSLDFLPFGEQIAGDTGTTHKLTGKERDSESGLDNFGARYDSSAIGRFMSPDWSASPEPVPFADLSNPQSLNLYAYVENNPINRIDSGGHAGKESLSGTNYLILKHRDNPNDMPNIHVYDKNNNEVGELRFNGKGQSRWVGAKNLGSQIKEQVEGIARAEGYAARAIDRQAAMDAVRAGRMTGRMSEAFGWLFLIDIAVNSVREAQTRKAEPDTGWHYDALSDKTVITDVDKAAASLAVGSQIQSQNGDVWTLGSDRQWTDSQGNHLFQCHGGQDVCSTEGMT